MRRLEKSKCSESNRGFDNSAVHEPFKWLAQGLERSSLVKIPHWKDLSEDLGSVPSTYIGSSHLSINSVSRGSDALLAASGSCTHMAMCKLMREHTYASYEWIGQTF